MCLLHFNTQYAVDDLPELAHGGVFRMILFCKVDKIACTI